MSDPNILLGHVTCPEGGRAEVYQTKKRGRHFYTRCQCCGLQQGTGAGRQQKIYNEAEFLPGVDFVMPSNVSKGPKPAPAAAQPAEPAPAEPEDFDPAKQEVSEPESKQPSEGVSGGWKICAGLMVLGASIGVGAWMS